MNTPGDFSQYHAELLDGIYDCVDRIVLNAFFPLGQTGGATGDPSIHGEFGSIMTWAYAQAQYFDAAKAAFAGGADDWLVAYARARGLTAVTQEVADPAVRNKVPIPNVCDAFGVRWINTFGMLRTLGAAFQ